MKLRVGVTANFPVSQIGRPERLDREKKQPQINKNSHESRARFMNATVLDYYFTCWKPRNPMPESPLQMRFREALDSLVETLRADSSVLSAILCGSLAYDSVWEGSDIDLVIVTVDDKKISTGAMSLYSGGINVHAVLIPRSEFRKTVDGSLDNSFMLSFLSHGELLFSIDSTVTELLSRVSETGKRDTQIQLLAAAASAINPYYKARKWLIIRGDLEYSSLWILFAANHLARLEVISARLIADREVLIQARKLNPELFNLIYSDLLNGKKSRTVVTAALNAIDAYLLEKGAEAFQPLLEYLEDSSEIRSCTEIEDHFKRNYGLDGLTMVCEYLADKGLIGKASTSARLTARSTAFVEELAFFSLGLQPPQ